MLDDASVIDISYVHILVKMRHVRQTDVNSSRKVKQELLSVNTE
jgi:hypothetical protein